MNGLESKVKDWQSFIQKTASDMGLDFFEQEFLIINFDDMCTIMGNTGMPVRFQHYSFGQEVFHSKQRGSYGFERVYELVINSDPCLAYLLDSNSDLVQQLVIAHVYGHNDFFKNNYWFKKTNRAMVNIMKTHRARINDYYRRHGEDAVERHIDDCLAIDNLIDFHKEGIIRPHQVVDEIEEMNPSEIDSLTGAEIAKKAGYMADIVMPEWRRKELLQELDNEQERREVRQADETVIEYPVKDVFGYLTQHGILPEWKKDIMRMLYQETMYFAPQRITKIMNEGWASYWHFRMIKDVIIPQYSKSKHDDVWEFAKNHSSVMSKDPKRINPYLIGLLIFDEIIYRWDRGQHGESYDRSKDLFKRDRWDKGDKKGLAKAFEVRKLFNDVSFIQTFLTEELFREAEFYTWHRRETPWGEKGDFIESRDFERFKDLLINQLTNAGQPEIYIIDSNFENTGALHLYHNFNGANLKQDWVQGTLAAIYNLWTRRVVLDTVQVRQVDYDKIKEIPMRYEFDEGRMNMYELDERSYPKRFENIMSIRAEEISEEIEKSEVSK